MQAPVHLRVLSGIKHHLQKPRCGDFYRAQLDGFRFERGEAGHIDGMANAKVISADHKQAGIRTVAELSYIRIRSLSNCSAGPSSGSSSEAAEKFSASF